MFAHHALGPRRRLPSGLILAAGIAALVAATPVFAATWTWDGSEGNDNWTNTLNWTPASAVDNNGTADLTFGFTPRLTPNMNLNWSVNSVTFNNTAGNYILSSLTGSVLNPPTSYVINYLRVNSNEVTSRDTSSADFPAIRYKRIDFSAHEVWLAFSIVCSAGFFDMGRCGHRGR